MEGHAIEVRNIVKSYGEVRALDGVSFTVMPAAIVGLVGPNAAGKSTLIRILASLSRPDAGEVRILGLEGIGAPGPARGIVGVMPEDLPLFQVLTGREQLSWAGAMVGLDQGLVRARTADLAAALQLERFLDRRISGYSKGTAKKLAFALALISDPRVVILDEPFEGVDPLSVLAMKQILGQFKRSAASILLSSHILGVLEDICTGFVVLDRGRVVFDGDRQAVASLAADVGKASSNRSGNLESIFLGMVAPDRAEIVLKTLAQGAGRNESAG